ncbi:TPA: hypothetical protein ACOEBX_004086 [Enterobacter roggenkampii]
MSDDVTLFSKPLDDFCSIELGENVTGFNSTGQHNAFHFNFEGVVGAN